MVPEQLGHKVDASLVLDFAHQQGFGHWLQLIPCRNQGRSDRSAKPAEFPTATERHNLPSLIAEAPHHAPRHRAFADAPHADELITRLAAMGTLRRASKDAHHVAHLFAPPDQVADSQHRHRAGGYGPTVLLRRDRLSRQVEQRAFLPRTEQRGGGVLRGRDRLPACGRFIAFAFEVPARPCQSGYRRDRRARDIAIETPGEFGGVMVRNGRLHCQNQRDALF